MQTSPSQKLRDFQARSTAKRNRQQLALGLDEKSTKSAGSSLQDAFVVDVSRDFAM
jgi:hypothetical protein